MTHSEIGETTGAEHAGLGANAAEMASLGSTAETEALPQPSVGEFYAGIAEEIQNPTLKGLVAQAAERQDSSRNRVWLGEDEAPGANGHARATEETARAIIKDALKDADAFLSAGPDAPPEGSNTLMDLQDYGNDFDTELRVALLDLLGANGPATDAVPDERQPNRFETRQYDTAIPGVRLEAWKHSAAPELQRDGTDMVKYRLVNASSGEGQQ